MDKKNIKPMMQDALNGEIPPRHIQLWPTVKTSLVTGESMKASHPRRVRRIAFAILIALSLLSVVLITPQGRAFAQDVLQFFKRAGSISFPLPPSPVETSILDSGKTNALLSFSSLAEAESSVGFDVKQFASELQGYVFRSVEANPALGIIYIHYDAVGGGGELVLAQSLSNFPSNSWGEVPPNAVEKVIVGGNEGEYVQGMFVAYSGAESAVWEPDAPVFRLRWKDSGRLFSLEKMGDTYPTEWLDKQALIALAESLVEQP
jgi:hypothetical protein